MKYTIYLLSEIKKFIKKQEKWITPILFLMFFLASCLLYKICGTVYNILYIMYNDIFSLVKASFIAAQFTDNTSYFVYMIVITFILYITVTILGIKKFFGNLFDTIIDKFRKKVDNTADELINKT